MRHLFIVLLTVAVFTACKNQQSENEKEFDDFLKKVEAFAPAPDNISNVINVIILSGAEYDASITNDTSFVEEYLEFPLLAALNCGSYSADALYHFAYNNSDAAFESYTAAQILANSLGFGPLYAGRTYDRFSARNEDYDYDSLFYEFDRVLKEVNVTLTQDERHQIKLAFLIGNTIEKLYLVDRILQSIEGNSGEKISLEANKLLHAFLNQEVALKNLVELLEKYKPEGEVPIFNEIIALYSLYYNLDERVETKYKDYNTFRRSDQIAAISDQIEVVRNLVIEVR